MKSEDVQLDMVTVHTVIKGLLDDLAASGHDFGDILLCRISW